MGIVLIASASLSIMAGLIGMVLTEFTDAFWNGLDRFGTQLKRLARARRASNRTPRHAGYRRHTGR